MAVAAEKLDASQPQHPLDRISKFVMRRSRDPAGNMGICNVMQREIGYMRCNLEQVGRTALFGNQHRTKSSCVPEEEKEASRMPSEDIRHS